MRTILVVVADEFGEHRAQMLLVQHDDVVQTLASKRSNHSLDDGIRPRCSNGRGDTVDTDPFGSLAEVATIHSIPIMEEMPRRVAPGRAWMTWRQTQAAVGFAVTFTCTSSRRP